MINKGKLILGMIAFLVVVLIVSGCISSNPKSPNEDIYIDGEPLIEQTKLDEHGNHVGGTGVLGEWGVMLSIRSKSGTAYNNLKINVTAYDANNQQIYTKIHTIPHLPKGLGENIMFGTGKREPVKVNITVVNATPET